MKFPRHWFRWSSAPPPPTLPIHTGDTPPGSPPPYDAAAGAQGQDAVLAGSVGEPGGLTGTGIGTQEKDPSGNVIILLREDYVTAKAYLRELDYKEAVRQLLKRQMYKWYLIIGIVIIFSVLITVKHDDIIHFLHPIIAEIRSWPGGWLIPIALLVVVSFPPLVGHEIIGILIGLVWGLGEGFAILAAGTFVGEVATWIAFKWCCTARAAKFEKKNSLYSALTQLIREKSFMFVLVLRFSAVPGHITTAVSASAGANFWQYLAAAFLTLPKQFTIVYLGRAFDAKDKVTTAVSITTTVLTLIGTIVAAAYIYYQMRLLMRRRTRITPIAVVRMSEAPTWLNVADIASAEAQRRHSTGGVIVLTGPAAGAGSTPRSPTDEKFRVDTATIDTALLPNQPRGRDRSKVRGWSVPRHMTEEEMRDFMAEMADSGPLSQAQVNAAANASASASNAAAAVASASTNAPHIFAESFNDDNKPKSPTTGHFTPTRAYTPAEDLVEPLDSYPPPRRGGASLDLGPRSSPRQSRDGGRQIADDADLFALSRGGRRPELGALRGESRAALLGRLRDDDAESVRSTRSTRTARSEL